MERPYLVDKPLGATPLEALEALRVQCSLGAKEKLAYAGRLDPLASGLLPILYGDMLKHQEDYWHLPKQYTASILLGISTDSYDVLGIPDVRSTVTPKPERITAIVRGMVGKIPLGVPVYSSHRYEGKPLFAWAKDTEEGPPVVPVRRMSISQIDIRNRFDMSSAELRKLVTSNVARVSGDFRQKEILAAWQQQLPDSQIYPVLDLDIQCASGTYMRSVAHEIGRRLGCGAVVTALRRVRVGPWRISDDDVVTLSSQQ